MLCSPDLENTSIVFTFVSCSTFKEPIVFPYMWYANVRQRSPPERRKEKGMTNVVRLFRNMLINYCLTIIWISQSLKWIRLTEIFYFISNKLKTLSIINSTHFWFFSQGLIESSEYLLSNIYLETNTAFWPGRLPEASMYAYHEPCFAEPGPVLELEVLPFDKI